MGHDIDGATAQFRVGAEEIFQHSRLLLDRGVRHELHFLHLRAGLPEEIGNPEKVGAEVEGPHVEAVAVDRGPVHEHDGVA